MMRLLAISLHSDVEMSIGIYNLMGKCSESHTEFNQSRGYAMKEISLTKIGISLEVNLAFTV